MHLYQTAKAQSEKKEIKVWYFSQWYIIPVLIQQIAYRVYVQLFRMSNIEEVWVSFLTPVSPCVTSSLCWLSCYVQLSAGICFSWVAFNLCCCNSSFTFCTVVLSGCCFRNPTWTISGSRLSASVRFILYDVELTKVWLMTIPAVSKVSSSHPGYSLLFFPPHSPPPPQYIHSVPIYTVAVHYVR
jgi:hypothetical protein